MKAAPLTLTLLALVVTNLAGCSQRQVYDAVQRSRQLECQRYPDARYEECMHQSDTPYEEYEAAREAVEPAHQ